MLKRYAKKMPSIRTRLVMKSEDSGGRHAPFWEDYRPHLIPSGSQDYLGVIVVNLPEESPVSPGDSANVEFDLCYHPNVDYSDLAVGARFEVREGNRIVGSGEVLEVIR